MSSQQGQDDSGSSPQLSAGDWVGGVVGLVLIVMGVAACIKCCCCPSRNNENSRYMSDDWKKQSPQLEPRQERELSSNPVSQHPEISKGFTYEDLKQATNGFSPSNLLGEGGFGRVYKGIIAGDIVAVKQLKIGSGQGEREFRAEVDIISRVHHRHLVSLVGYCISDVHRILVYKFVPNGTLEQALHGPGKSRMNWAVRMNIAVGTARGLAYLHEDCNPRIIHRDIKGSNILLDSEWKAQVADFGFAKLADDFVTHISTRVIGTFGYMAPEYAMSGQLTDKSDVYSFGVVLLELITGKKAVNRSPQSGDGHESLVEWARPLLTRALETGNVDDVVDPQLNNDSDREDIFRMVEVAANCVRHSYRERPKMVEALSRLTRKDGDLHQGVLPGHSNELIGADTNMSPFRHLAFSNSTSVSNSGGKSESRRDAWIPSSTVNEIESWSREHVSAKTSTLGSREMV